VTSRSSEMGFPRRAVSAFTFSFTQSLARTRATIPRTTQSRRWQTWPSISSFCRH